MVTRFLTSGLIMRRRISLHALPKVNELHCNEEMGGGGYLEKDEF